MNETKTLLLPLPWGPLPTIFLVLLLGFILMSMINSWHKKETYEPPFREIMALTLIMGVLGLAYYSFVGKVSETGDVILGVLLAGFTAVITAYFRKNGNGHG